MVTPVVASGAFSFVALAPYPEAVHSLSLTTDPAAPTRTSCTSIDTRLRTANPDPESTLAIEQPNWVSSALARFLASVDPFQRVSVPQRYGGNTMNVQSNPEKSAATRLAAQEFARWHLKQAFADTAHWRELAAAAGFRLPLWYLPASAGGVRRYALGLGLTLEQITDATGCKSFRTFAEMNPDWPLWAVVGLLLELAEELKK